MAEFVQQSIEDMVTELNQLQNAGLFSALELREVIKKRKALEYKLRRRTKEKQDFLFYIKYEMNVLALIKKRRKLNKCMVKVKDIEGPIIRRIHKLFDLACVRFKDDVKLWLSHIEFCRQKHEKKRASQLYTNLLKIHPHNPDVWVLAAKHEMELRESMPGARTLLQKALAVNPDSKQLWIKYFHMELLNAESLRQKLADVAAMEFQGHESDALVVNGEVAKIVYANACLQFLGDVDLRLEFLDTARLFNFTDALQDAIITDLETNFKSSEVALSAVAKHPLHKAFELYPQFDQFKDTIQELEQKSYKLFESAVTSLPSEKMWSHYLETCLEVLKYPHSKHHSRRHVSHALTLFSRAFENQLLSEQMALSWLSVLRKTGQIQEALSVSDKLVRQFIGSIRLWMKRVQLVMETSTDHDTIKNCANTAITACISLKNVLAIDLWRMILTWYISHCSALVSSLCEIGLSAKSSDVCLFIKEVYIDFTALNGDILAVRKLYRRLIASQPVSVSLLNRYVAVEVDQAKPKMKHVRRAFEEALLIFGAKDINIWLNYIKIELTSSCGKPENVAHLHWRAEKDLDSSLVDEFKQQFAQLNCKTIDDIC